MKEIVIELMAWHANVWLAHWQADTLTTRHETLGELYEAMAPIIDRFSEAVMVKTGSRDFPAQALQLRPMVDLGELVTAGREILGKARALMAAGVDDHLLNMLAEMAAAITNAAFLLKV